MKPDFRTQVAEEMIRQIEAGTTPWQKPWKPGVIRSKPFNPSTGKDYRGINGWWLEMQGRSDPRWMTYRQAQALDAQVRKGERSSLVEYWQWSVDEPVTDADGRPVLDDEGRQKTKRVTLERPRVFRAAVFNAEQIEGLAPLVAPKPTFEPVPEAERILAAGGVPIHHDQGDRAFYRRTTDEIHLPVQAAFADPYEYYATALHELGHATGHDSRLARTFGPFGSQAYAAEELRAEMASFLLTTELGLGHYPERHANYVESWLKVLQNDRNELFRAAREAETIRTWVMDPEMRPELHRRAALTAPDIAPVVAPAPEQAQVQDQAPRRSDQLLASVGRYFRNEADLHSRKRGDTTTLHLDGDELATVQGPLTQDTISRALGEALSAAFKAEGRTLPTDIAKMSLDEFTAAYRLGKILPEFEIPAKDIGSVITPGADGLLQVDVRELHARIQAGEVVLTPEAAAEQAPRLYLDVPFAEKNAAKAAGAKWDKAAKSWYAPEDLGGADVEKLLEKWPAKDTERTPNLAKPAAARPAPQRDATEKAARVYLAVPYEQKNAAKAAGARWDRHRKAWYVGADADMKPFEKWRAQDVAPAKGPATPEQEFADALRAQGLILKDPPIMDGRWHRVPVEGDKKGVTSGSYRGFMDGVPNGQITNYKTAQTAVPWVATGVAIDPAERAQLQAEAAQRQARRDAEKAAAQQEAAQRAQGLLSAADRVTGEAKHPYLERKGIPALSDVRVKDDTLLIPMTDAGGAAVNVQRISPDGEKRYMKDGQKQGAFHMIDPKGMKARGPVLVAEGYATGASLHHATGLPVAVAFDAGNLKAVGEILRASHPQAPLLFASDDDHKQELAGKPNVGIVKAAEAAQAVGGVSITPRLSDTEKAQGLSDFNDLVTARGPQAEREIRKQVAEALETLKPQQQLRQTRKQQPANALAM